MSEAAVTVDSSVENDTSRQEDSIPSAQLSKGLLIGSWGAQLVAAGILGMTVVMKFANSAETQLIFENLGGRPAALFTGAIEALAVVLLLWSSKAIYGGLLTLMIMGGAILSHVFVLGIASPTPDGGKDPSLFIMAVVVAIAAASIVTIRRRELPFMNR